MTPLKKQLQNAAPDAYDYGGLEAGMRVQAELDGVYYAADVVQVSTSKNRSQAPVKVSFCGYNQQYDEWVDGYRLRSKHLKVVKREKIESAPERKQLEVTFGYWKIRGLGAVFRMIFEHMGITYTDNQYDGQEGFDKWFKEDKPKILEKNVLANLPYLECGNVCVCQTNAILGYLGNRLRISGGSYNARIKNQELLWEIYDVRNLIIDLSYPYKNVNPTEAEYTENVIKHLASNPFKKFEASLEKDGTEYFCGESPCTADFHIWEMLDQHRLLSEKHQKGDIFGEIPKCKAFYDRFRALPSLQKYFESEAYKFPVNKSIANAYFQ